MAHYQFNKDLEDGHRAEEEVLEKLATYFKVKKEDIERCHNKDFDLNIAKLGLTFEVKNDLMAAKTGNIAIEYECRGKPTCLAISKADFWIYKFDGSLWVVPTKLLRQKLFKEKRYFRQVTGGDKGSNTRMFLVKTKAFKSWGYEL
jgi:hypothetical protein